jgi:hypothetical protein
MAAHEPSLAFVCLLHGWKDIAFSGFLTAL